VEKQSYKVREIVEIDGVNFIKGQQLRGDNAVEFHVRLPLKFGPNIHINKDTKNLMLTGREALSLAKKGYIAITKMQYEAIKDCVNKPQEKHAKKLAPIATPEPRDIAKVELPHGIQGEAPNEAPKISKTKAPKGARS
jgi:hypothetical protein